jgi:Tfp pilus assembly protein PilX
MPKHSYMYRQVGSRLVRRVVARLAHERGIALVMALMVLTVLTVLTISMLE